MHDDARPQFQLEAGDPAGSMRVGVIKNTVPACAPRPTLHGDSWARSVGCLLTCVSCCDILRVSVPNNQVQVDAPSQLAIHCACAMCVENNAVANQVYQVMCVSRQGSGGCQQSGGTAALRQPGGPFFDLLFETIYHM